MGATGQLGQTFSKAAIVLGYNLVLVARTKSKLLDLKNVLDVLQPEKSIVVAANINNPEEVEHAFNLAIDQFGVIDTVINIAAIAAKGPIIESNVKEAESILHTNVLGSLTMIKIGASFIKRSGGGQIINIASTAGLCPMPSFSLYGMSKAAQIHLTKIAAIELAKDDIQVNAVCPGIINNEILDDWLKTEQGNNYRNKLPKNSITSVMQVSETLLWLIEAPNMSLTGNMISPDGGFQYFSNQSKS